MKVSIFQNLKNPVVAGEDTIDGIINKIRNGYTKSMVEKARDNGKGSFYFNSIKEQIQTFSPNALFSKRRTIKDLVELSGFIYLDFDHVENIESIKNFPYIYSCWRSVSGIGYGALVKVDGLTIINFTQTWELLNSYFKNIAIEIDSHCKDITRQNVISFDPYLYINSNCESLRAVESLNRNISSTTSINPHDYDFSAASISIDLNGFHQNKLNYKTTLDDYEGLDYKIIMEGKESMDSYLPKIIKDGERHKWISRFIVVILFNNRDITKDRLIKEVFRINKQHCMPNLEPKEVFTLVTWYFDRHLNNEIDFHPRNKMIWFNPDSGMSYQQKRSVIGKFNGVLRRQRTISRLKKIYNELKLTNSKVTQQMVFEHEKNINCIRSIKMYWSELIK